MFVLWKDVGVEKKMPEVDKSNNITRNTVFRNTVLHTRK